MQYDIEFMLPITGAILKYKKRIDDLKRVGFYNIGNCKVLITLLVGSEEIDGLGEGWPEGCHVNIVSSSKIHPASKVYDFLSKITPEYVSQSNWFAKIDDDTINDVSGLVRGLNEQYDLNSPFYLVTRIQFDCDRNEFDLLNKLGYSKWWEQGGVTLQHEHEGCIFSKKAMELMAANPKCLELYEERSKISAGWTDQCMGAAARILKIYPIKSPMLASIGESFRNFSIFNDGPIKHFHEFSHDKTPGLMNIFNKMRDNENNPVFQKLKNREYFLIFEHPMNIAATHVYFHENHSFYRPVLGDLSRRRDWINECFWGVEGDKLQIYGNRGETLAEFDCSNLNLTEEKPSISKFSICLNNPIIRYMIYSKL